MNEAAAITVAVAAGFVSAAVIWACMLHRNTMLMQRKHELFEQRFEVYIEFWEEAYAIIQIGPPDDERRRLLMALLQRARFLFDEKIYAYLVEFLDKADELARSEFTGKEAEGDETRLSQARMDNLMWFDRQSEEIARIFSPYLSVEASGAPKLRRVAAAKATKPAPKRAQTAQQTAQPSDAQKPDQGAAPAPTAPPQTLGARMQAPKKRRTVFPRE